MARLFAHANGRWLLENSFGRKRIVHADRIHGDVYGAGNPFPLSYPAGDRARTRSRGRNGALRSVPAGILRKANYGNSLVHHRCGHGCGVCRAGRIDLGAGVIYLTAARTPAERQAIMRSIGPVWDGNEVWLLAAGGTLYFAFPLLYASSFSGFYLPLMMVLWLLMLRGIGIELRAHMDNPVWRGF